MVSKSMSVPVPTPSESGPPTSTSAWTDFEYDLGVLLPWDNAEVMEDDPNITVVLGETGVVLAVFNKEEGLQDAYSEYLSVAKFGDRFTPLGLNASFQG